MSDSLAPPGSFPKPPQGFVPPQPQAEAPAPAWADDGYGPESQPPPFAPKTRTNVLLFFATLASVFFVGSNYASAHFKIDSLLRSIGAAWIYALPLMAILLAHEFGHYIAARIHKVPASLPYFLPLPILNPFGTLGAVIVMPERIRSRNALMDIGAAGPLAGMVVAIPLMFIGIRLSDVTPGLNQGVVVYEGDSLLYWGLKRLALGELPPGYDIQTHPLALAAWVGFFVTFLNLFPISQLDGGHIAYALFGERQNRFARYFRFSPLILAVYNFVAHGLPAIQRYVANGRKETLDLLPMGTIVNWVMLFLLLWFMTRKVGPGHPPVDDDQLSTGRKVVGVISLIVFILVFTPTPWLQYVFS
ncbi:MAG: site-2 protease family protein [Polyangiaceae bacterium]